MQVPKQLEFKATDEIDLIVTDSGQVVISGGSGGPGLGGIVLTANNGAPILISPINGLVLLQNLPTSDPHQPNAVWVDTTAGYVLKLSQG